MTTFFDQYVLDPDDVPTLRFPESPERHVLRDCDDTMRMLLSDDFMFPQWKPDRWYHKPLRAVGVAADRVFDHTLDLRVFPRILWVWGIRPRWRQARHDWLVRCAWRRYRFYGSPHPDTIDWTCPPYRLRPQALLHGFLNPPNTRVYCEVDMLYEPIVTSCGEGLTSPEPEWAKQPQPYHYRAPDPTPTTRRVRMPYRNPLWMLL